MRGSSGKTYSLIKVIDWLQDNMWHKFKYNNQKVACITYTNAAVDVIQSRLDDDTFIIPSTIHSFVWQTMKQFQNELTNNIKKILMDKKDAIDFSKINKIEYTLGKRYQDENILYLYHDDVIKLFVLLMDNEKFRRLLESEYPIILIDEYQDASKSIIEQFIKYFIDEKRGPQFGFFGDPWQTIYQMQDAVGEIENENIIIIQKKFNFRSAQNIVEMLNKIRPEMPQISALDYDGCVTVIDCNDYVIGRQSQGQFMNELPLNIFSERLEKIEKIIFDEKKGTRKTLMLTHKIIANKNKYPEVLELLGDDFKDLIDPFLVFFMEKTELIFKGLNENKTNYIFEALGVRQYPINTIADKKKWKYFYEKLEKSRQGTVKDVLDTFNESNFITFPDVIEKIYRNILK